jgi:type III polyketide synthase
LLDLPLPASIKEVSDIFLKEGLALSLSASRRAIDEAGLAVDEITHVVATTCTNSSNPGFDSYLAQELGLRPSVEKVLLHGVGCAGGLAALRLAASLCQAAAWRGEPAHVLLIACEITSTMRRDELEKISRDQQIRIGITLFGDGASSLILSLDPGDINPANKFPKSIYELVNWAHLTVPDTHSDLRIDVDALGKILYFLRHIANANQAGRFQTDVIGAYPEPHRVLHTPSIRGAAEDSPEQIRVVNSPVRPQRL